jgi:hypothetical protein
MALIEQKEKDGVMTVKFKDSVSAQACIIKMDGRYFDGRRVSDLGVRADVLDISSPVHRQRTVSEIRRDRRAEGSGSGEHGGAGEARQFRSVAG